MCHILKITQQPRRYRCTLIRTLRIMDSTDYQLRFGASLSASQANDLSMCIKVSVSFRGESFTNKLLTKVNTKVNFKSQTVALVVDYYTYHIIIIIIIINP
jgi:hypothetical protein